jgi:hypothetical protein
MDAHYSFELDRGRSLIRIRMSGLFTLADVEAFLRDRREAHARLDCGPNQHLTLNDLRGMKIQLPEVVTAFRDLLGAPEYRSRRLAFVAGPTLARSQLMRALSGRDARCFENISTAEAWLFAAEAEEVPLRRAG